MKIFIFFSRSDLCLNSATCSYFSADFVAVYGMGIVAMWARKHCHCIPRSQIIARMQSPTLNPTDLNFTSKFCRIKCSTTFMNWRVKFSFYNSYSLSQQLPLITGETGPFNFYSLIRKSNEHERKIIYYQ